MRIWLVIVSVFLFALGTAPAIRSAPIGFQMTAPQQSLIPVQKKKGKGWGKQKRAGKQKGKGPRCFDRCIAKGEKSALGCSFRCR